MSIPSSDSEELNQRLYEFYPRYIGQGTFPVVGSIASPDISHYDSGYIIGLQPIFSDPNNIEYYTMAEERRRWESRFDISSWETLNVEIMYTDDGGVM